MAIFETDKFKLNALCILSTMKNLIISWCLLFAPAFLPAQAAMSSGTVKYKLTSSVFEEEENVFFTSCFKPGIAAGLMTTVVDDEVYVDYHSVFDFKTDDLFTTIITDDDTLTMPASKISETLAGSPLQFSLKEDAVSKTILGYKCTKFTAYSADSNAVMEGWATPLLQSKVRPVLDQALMSGSFPLLMTLTMKTAMGMQTMVYEAVEIKPEVDDKVFVLTTKKAPEAKFRQLSLSIAEGWERVPGEGIYLLRVKNKATQTDLAIEDFTGSIPNVISADKIPPEYANTPYPERLKKIVEFVFQPDKDGQRFIPALEKTTAFGATAYQFRICPEKMDARWNCSLTKLLMFENKPYLVRVVGIKANFEASLATALSMLETLKIAAE